MSQEKLPIGKLIHPNDFYNNIIGRDAIHIAICPVVAAEMLEIGALIGFVEDGNWTRVSAKVKNKIGIVDPFLKLENNLRVVCEEDIFYMYLLPNTITGLRHVWTHPAFNIVNKSLKQELEELSNLNKDKEIEASKIWLSNYAITLKPYNTSEDAIKNFFNEIKENKIYAYGTDLSSANDLDNKEEFFKHLRIYLGRDINEEDISYHCSC